MAEGTYRIDGEPVFPWRPDEAGWPAGGASFRFPQPGERHNHGRQIVDDKDVGTLLIMAATLLDLGRLFGQQDEETYRAECQAWWRVCNNMPRWNRVLMQKTMSEGGTPMPECWEDEPR
jgi:hypothetical protein